jgi:Putative transposase
MKPWLTPVPQISPKHFAALYSCARRMKWNVHVKPPFGGPEQVLKYLARYTHRVAISNSRILSIADGKVTFLWKDYADAGKVKPMTLDAVEFIRRFLLHILPAGFVRIRQFGFLANRARREKLVLCRALRGAPSAPPRTALTDVQGRKTDEKLWPVCKTGHMILIRLPYTERLAAPPLKIDSS